MIGHQKHQAARHILVLRSSSVSAEMRADAERAPAGRLIKQSNYQGANTPWNEIGQGKRDGKGACQWNFYCGVALVSCFWASTFSQEEWVAYDASVARTERDGRLDCERTQGS
jgi:hypothetical protein